MLPLFVATLLLLAVFSPVFANENSNGAFLLGDGKISNQPKRGSVMACQSMFPGGGGAHRVGEWIKNGYWYPEEKPMVEGRINWSNAEISVSVEGDFRVFRSNKLPVHSTGKFPIQPGTEAYKYDRNPNSIREQSLVLKLPATPVVAETPDCVPMGLIGYSLTGSAIFNAFDAAGRDAPAYEIQDHCNAHPERGGTYHYHDWSECIPDKSGDSGNHSDIAGFMLDGFPIFGPKGENGVTVTNNELDECHGHTHNIVIDGKTVSLYHYHFTHEFPYTIGCFRGSNVA
ncbi:MAG: YHYH protein [Spirulinaceae cyanobacterium]